MYSQGVLFWRDSEKGELRWRSGSQVAPTNGGSGLAVANGRIMEFSTTSGSQMHVRRRRIWQVHDSSVENSMIG